MHGKAARVAVIERGREIMKRGIQESPRRYFCLRRSGAERANYLSRGDESGPQESALLTANSLCAKRPSFFFAEAPDNAAGNAPVVLPIVIGRRRKIHSQITGLDNSPR